MANEVVIDKLGMVVPLTGATLWKEINLVKATSDEQDKPVI